MLLPNFSIKLDDMTQKEMNKVTKRQDMLFFCERKCFSFIQDKLY